MEIVETPVKYSYAGGNVIFRIAADPQERFDMDVYDHAGTTVIGRKRFAGAELYEMNVGGYVRQQIEVEPVVSSRSGFSSPAGRLVDVTVKCGEVSGTGTVVSALHRVYSLTRLSQAPATAKITATQTYEIAMLPENEALTAEALFEGDNGSGTLVLATRGIGSGIAVLHINMKDVERKLKSASMGTLSDYRTMRVDVSSANAQWCSQRFRIVEDRPEDVRLCWWNSAGQIDYYTMRRVARRTVTVRKERVYTAEGYRTAASETEVRLDVESDYETEETLRWLEEIVSAPRVWMFRAGTAVPMEIVTQSVVTETGKLAKMEVSMVERVRSVCPAL